MQIRLCLECLALYKMVNMLFWQTNKAVIISIKQLLRAVLKSSLSPYPHAFRSGYESRW